MLAYFNAGGKTTKKDDSDDSGGDGLTAPLSGLATAAGALAKGAAEVASDPSAAFRGLGADIMSGLPALSVDDKQKIAKYSGGGANALSGRPYYQF